MCVGVFLFFGVGNSVGLSCSVGCIFCRVFFCLGYKWCNSCSWVFVLVFCSLWGGGSVLVFFWSRVGSGWFCFLGLVWVWRLGVGWL